MLFVVTDQMLATENPQEPKTDGMSTRTKLIGGGLLATFGLSALYKYFYGKKDKTTSFTVEVIKDSDRFTLKTDPTGRTTHAAIENAIEKKYPFWSITAKYADDAEGILPENVTYYYISRDVKINFKNKLDLINQLGYDFVFVPTHDQENENSRSINVNDIYEKLAKNLAIPDVRGLKDEQKKQEIEKKLEDRLKIFYKDAQLETKSQITVGKDEFYNLQMTYELEQEVNE